MFATSGAAVHQAARAAQDLAHNFGTNGIAEMSQNYGIKNPVRLKRRPVHNRWYGKSNPRDRDARHHRASTSCPWLAGSLLARSRRVTTEQLGVTNLTVWPIRIFSQRFVLGPELQLHVKERRFQRRYLPSDSLICISIALIRSCASAE